MLRKISKIILSALMALSVISWSGISASAQEENLALNRPVTVSGVEGGVQDDGTLTYPQFDPSNLTDDNASTRWSSDEALTSIDLEDNPDQNVWAMVDLGEEKEIGTVVMKWQNANSRDYDVQVSSDAQQWTVLHHYVDPDNDGRDYTETLELAAPISARYVRIYARLGTIIASIDNMQCPTISLYELEVYPYSDEVTLEDVLAQALEQPVQAEGDDLVLPQVPQGYTIRLYATSNPAVVSEAGKIITPLEDMNVNLFYEISDAEGNVLQGDDPKKVTIAGQYAPQESINEKPDVIPELREWKGDTGSFVFNGRIVIEDAQLQQTAEQIAMYLKEMSDLDCVITQDDPQTGDIVLRLDESSVLGEEGYAMDIGDILTVSALSEKGILYGGTSISQILSQDEGHDEIPKGQVRDYPQYAVRAVMLDVARQYIPLDYLSELTRYAGYFKLSEFRNHINDNGGEQTVAFRVESKVYPQLNEGLPKDQVYSQEAYKAYQKDAKKYGVDVVTEIDTPAHAGAFANIDESLLMDGYHLDLRTEEAYQNAVGVMKNVFDEFLDGEDPVFQNGKFHIGTDEYDKSYSEVVRRYMNELIEYVNGKGYETRFWASLGTNGFAGETPVSTDVIAHMWSHSWASFDEMKDAGYRFINNADGILYIVPWAGYYNNYLNIASLYDTWEYSNLNGGHYLQTGHPQLLGGEAALWYDMKVGASEFDIFDRQRDQVMLMAEKGWYGEDDDETSDEFMERVEALGTHAPNANPGRYVESESSLVASYDFDDIADGIAEDASGNGYDAEVHDLYAKDDALRLKGEGYLSLPFDTLGYPYTLQCDITIDSATGENALLFSGKDGKFYYNYDGTGHFGYERKGYAYLIDADIPLGVTFAMTIVCDETNTSLYINGMFVGSGEYYQVSGASSQGSSTFVMPTEQIGEGIYGTMDDLKLYNYAMSAAQVAGASESEDSGNIALHKNVEVSGVEGGYNEDGTLVYPQFDPANATDGSESTRISLNTDDDAWVSVDLEKPYLLDRVIIRFNELPNAYAIQVSEDGQSWTQVAEYRDLNGGTKQTVTVHFDHLVKARYVKYQQLERFTYGPTGGRYSGNFTEFEVYGYDTERFVQFIAEAQERLSSCDDGSAFAQSVYTDLQTLEAMLETGPVSTMNQLANMISDKLTMLENDNAPQAVPDKSALQTLLGETLNENEYSEQSWNKYAQALDYGSTIYYHAGANQALVDYACARIEEAKAGLSMRNYITISSNKSVYQDHALSRLIDGDTSSLTWLQNNQAQGDYIQFSFREPLALSQIDIYSVNAGSDILHHGRVEISADGNSWQSIAEIGENEHEVVTLEETPVMAVRITVTQAAEYWWKITEVMFNEAQIQDKAVLEEELNKQVDLSLYSEASVQAYEAARAQAEAVFADEQATQPQIDTAAAQLVAAREALEKKLDKSALGSLLGTKLEADAYTPSSYAEYEEAYLNAQDVYDDANATQNEVDQAAWKLQEAVSRLVIADFKDELNDLIAQASAWNEDEYTANSWTPFMEALDQAKETAADEQATKADTDEAAAALRAAMDALQRKASEAAMAALQDIVDQAEALQNDELNDLIANANALLTDPDNASATALISALLDLSEAMQALNAGESTDALKADLEETIQFINANILPNVDNVRPGKVQALKDAITAAQDVLDDEEATADQLKQANRTLTKAAQELWQIVSKNELNEMITAANGYAEGSYTAESIAALQDAITVAQSVADNDDATTAEVTEAITSLADAIASLEKIVLDTSALAHEIELAEAILANIDDYVPGTVEGLQEKVDAAKTALDAMTQEEIDAATQTLREARLRARTKADKSALDELIETANAMTLGGYGRAQVLAFRQALVQAQQISIKEDATQEEVNEVTETLSTAMREMLESAISAGTDSEAAKTMAELQTDAFVLLLMTSALMAWMLKRRNVRS